MGVRVWRGTRSVRGCLPPSHLSVTHRAGGRKQLTIHNVARQDQHVLQNVGPLGSALEDALRLAIAEQQIGVRLHIALDGLLALFLAHLVDCLDVLELLVRNRFGPHSALPGDGPRADVVLQRHDVRWRVDRHGEGAALDWTGLELFGLDWSIEGVSEGRVSPVV